MKEAVGRFVYDVPTDRWWWSEGVFEIHGFRPGEVVPTTALVLAHRHPEDRDWVTQVGRTALAVGEPFSVRHRIIDAHQQERTVLCAGHGVRADDGTVRQVRGHFVDLTPARREYQQYDVERAVADFATHRAVIEQAKGVLMHMFSIDADAAFTLLTVCSSRVNIKVRALSRLITDATVPNQPPAAQVDTEDALAILSEITRGPGRSCEGTAHTGA